VFRGLRACACKASVQIFGIFRGYGRFQLTLWDHFWYYSTVANEEITALRCHCEVCGHEWISDQRPRRCAKCKSRKWDRSGDGRNGVHLRGSVSRAEGEGGVSEAVRGTHEKAGPQRKSRTVDRSAEADRSGEGTAEIKATALTGERLGHDVKSCRVYRCAQCIAAGKKF
jgi:hypothetical protein